jgi:hypothetical protein
MQYSKRRAKANRQGTATTQLPDFMPHRFLKGALRVGAVLGLLALPACTDTISSSAPPSSGELLRDYDRTLTNDEQKAVIGEMQAEAQRKGAKPAPAAAR